MLKRIFFICILAMTTLLLPNHAAAKLVYTISGPTSVNTGTVYTYTVSPATPSNYSWSVTKGVVDDYSTTSATVIFNTTGSAQVVVKDQNNTVVATLSVTIGTPPPLTGGSINNTSQTINYNTVPATITATAATGGTCGSYSYQWQSSSDNSYFSDISGANDVNYTPPALSSTTYYRRKVTCTGDIQYTNTAVVNVYPQLYGGTISPASTILYNSDPGTLTLSNVSGGNGNYTYQWQSSPDNINFSNINSSGTTFSPGILTATTYYRVIVTSNGVSGYSYVVTITVVPHLAPGTISGNAGPVSYNTSTGLLSGTSATGGICTSYSYQWQQSSDNITFYDIVGATDVNYTPVLNYTSYFRRKVSCGSETVYSNVISVQVNPQLLPGTITPGRLTISSGTNPGTLTANAASGGTCNGSYTYQWQQSADGTNFTDISGATNQNYTPGTLTVTTSYRRRVSCGADNACTNVSVITVVSSLVTDMNYIRVRDITKPQITTVTSTQGLTDPADVKQTTQYFDGLGRLVQTVQRQGSPLLKDVVTTTMYDEFSREVTKYLPYVASTDDGNYKANPLPELTSFNAGLFQGEQYYYSQTDYEPSPTEQMLRSYAPGQNWVGASRGVNAGMWFNEVADDVRKWSVTDNANGWGTYHMDGSYDPAVLYKNISIDEKGNQVIEFKNKEGQVILKKVQLKATADNGAGTGYTNWLCTYYIYDHLNLLRAVIQPHGVELLIQNGWDITALSGDILNEQCFRYEYDSRNRMIRKKVPGAGEVYMIYDIRDRLVFTQDANLRLQNQWLTTLYDNLDRPVITGLNTWTGTPADLQSAVTYQTTNGVLAGVQTNWTLNQPNTSGDYQATQSITMDDGFVSAADADFTAEIVQGVGSLQSIVAGMQISNNPLPDGSSFTLLTKTGYDDYATLPTESNLTTTIDNTYTGSNYLNTSYNSFPYAEPVVQSLQTRGMITWTQTKVLGTTSQYLYATSVYDEKGRPVQVKSKNITGGTDIVTTQYTFTTQPLVTVQKHEYVSSSNPQTHIVVNKNNYDPQGRLKSLTKTINSTINGVAISKPELEIVNNQYNELGQLINRNIGKKKDANGNYTSAPVQSLAYDYNIRGWLLGVNRNYLATEGQTSDGTVFGFELGYDNATNKSGQNFTASQYDGNIAGILWKSDGDDIRRKYDFTYDAANRLLRGDFTQQNVDDHQWNNSKVNYNVKLGDGVDPALAYDANGNILRMQQWGLTVTGSTQIDDLHYNYYKNNNSNKLSAVTDLAAGGTPPTGGITGLGDFADKNTSGNDYGYDQNGNMVTDLNKKLSGTADLDLTTGGAITYNHLDLPTTINVKTDDGSASKGTITYIYDAAGSKLQKVTLEKSVSVAYNNQSYISDITTTTNYLDGFVYESKAYNYPALSALQYTDKLQFLAQEEGRVRYLAAENTTPAHFEYDYFIKDHLGNVRMVLTEEQKTDVYQATMEDANRAAEVALFGDKINSTSTPKTGNLTNFDSDGSNQKVSVVNGTTAEGRVGPGVILKVMAGDKITAKTFAWYQASGMDNSTDPGLTGIITNLLGQLVPGITGAAHGTIASQVSNGVVQPGMESFLGTQNQASGAPKAYLNWVLLDDEQFKMVNASSGVVPVPVIGATEQKHLLEANNGNPIEMTRNGYLYVFVSNESKGNVYFDDIRVEHIRGPLTEETHYYPFGLTMAGISSKAIKSNYAENKYKFNDGTELNTSLDVNLYETTCRLYDPQLGRFTQIDGHADEFGDWSPYTFAVDNPILANDPTGLDSLTRKANLDPVYVTAKRQSKGDVYMRRLALGAQKGISGPVIYESDRSDLQDYLRAMNRYEDRRNAFNTAEANFTVEVAAWIIPWGRVIKGAAWAYRLGKARQAFGAVGGVLEAAGVRLGKFGSTRLGKYAWAATENVVKDVLANRGNIKSADLFDITTSTIASGFGIWGKIGTELLNVTTDINIDNGVQMVGFGKKPGAVFTDLMFGFIKFTGVEIGNATGAKEGSKTTFELLIDQTKTSFNNATPQ